MSDFVNIITQRKIILLLGMVYSDNEYDFLEPYGQEYRDLVRCEALSSLGFNVYTLDDKHAPVMGKHCNANFNDFRRMRKSFEDQKVYRINLCADFIILDYFFSPEGWSFYRWNEMFIETSLICFVTHGVLAPNGVILLPNMKCIDQYINNNLDHLNAYFDIKKMTFEDTLVNHPLVVATDLAEQELINGNPNPYINSNQLDRLDQNYPFYSLTNKVFSY